MARPRRRDDETSALYVRLPTAEAQKLDRAAYALNAPKRDLVTQLVARYVDPDDPAALSELAGTEPLTLGRHSFRANAAPEVLTLAQLAELLQVDEETAGALAETGQIPGRKVGDEWRFSRQAVLDWLAESEQ